MIRSFLVDRLEASFLLLGFAMIGFIIAVALP